MHHLVPYFADEERIIRARDADPYIFRVRDEYHQFYIDYIDRKYPDSDADSDVESDAESDAESGVESDDSREIL